MSSSEPIYQPVVTTVDLIRHGEPEGGRLFRGWRDDPLSAQGWQQMREAIGEHQAWDQIVTSPLRRCVEFATELSRQIHIPLSREERLKEIGFGQWEGQSPEALYAESPERMSRFWQDPVSNPPPEGESMILFQSRVESAWQDLIIAHAGQHLLVVAHGGVNRMLVGKVMGIPLRHLFRIEWPYAAVSRIRIEDGFPRLVFHAAGLGASRP